VMDHALDASRYAVYNKLSKPNYGRYSIRWVIYLWNLN
jgi:hypothetical protein